MSIPDLVLEQPPFPRYLNTKQAAAYLNLSSQYLEIARHKGGGPSYIKLAKAVRYRQEDLDDWMARHRQQHTAQNMVARGPAPDTLADNAASSLDDDVGQDVAPTTTVGMKMRGGKNLPALQHRRKTTTVGMKMRGGENG